MKIKLKRTFRFRKIKKNLIVKKGTSILDDSCEYTILKDSSLLSFIIAVAAQKDIQICSFACSEYTDEGYITVYSTKNDFLALVAEILDKYADYISTCQI